MCINSILSYMLYMSNQWNMTNTKTNNMSNYPNLDNILIYMLCNKKNLYMTSNLWSRLVIIGNIMHLFLVHINNILENKLCNQYLWCTLNIESNNEHITHTMSNNRDHIIGLILL